MSENESNTQQVDPQPESPSASTPSTLSSEERTWALIGHLSAFTFFVTGGIGCIIGPLVVWLIKRDSLPFAADQAKEALNFNITVALAGLVLLIFTIVTFGIGVLLAWPLAVALFIAWVILTIIAAVKSNEGVSYRYPFALRLVK